MITFWISGITGIMNLDALLEDLEAQGYFASTETEAIPESNALCRSVIVVRSSCHDAALVMPLLGKDFIAGFQNRITKSSWLLIQDYSYLRPLDQGNALQATQLSFKKVVQKHLIGVSLRLSLAPGSPEQVGYITRGFGDLFEFVTFEAKTLWIPSRNIIYLVVDKLSINS
jgi:hypothetical protein